MMNSTSSILKISHLALPSLISIISLKIQTLSMPLSLTVSYHSLYTCFTWILIILIFCAKFIQSRQFLRLIYIGFRQASLVTYFCVELSCTKVLYINFKKRAFSWLDRVILMKLYFPYFLFIYLTKILNRIPLLMIYSQHPIDWEYDGNGIGR